MILLSAFIYNLGYVCARAHRRARTVSYPQNCLGRLYSQSNQCLMCPTPPLHLTGPTVNHFFFFFLIQTRASCKKVTKHKEFLVFNQLPKLNCWWIMRMRVFCVQSILIGKFPPSPKVKEFLTSLSTVGSLVCKERDHFRDNKSILIFFKSAKPIIDGPLSTPSSILYQI